MAIDVHTPTPLLGGLSPDRFMRRHWQRKPLVIRQAWPDVRPPIDRAALFDLAGSEDVESRLLTAFDGRWQLRHGPFSRRQIPSPSKAGWTLLVQGLDLHQQAAHEMLQRFRFVPEARLDDLMISYASEGGGVGPHLDSYDVFLLQVHGRRRWRIGPVRDRSLVPGLPVRILANFEPTEEVVLEPGDMLYLPPLYGHDGIAEGGDCMTCSIGFRAATATGLATELLHQIADAVEPPEPGAREPIYKDPGAPAVTEPGRLPASLVDFARDSLRRVLDEPDALPRALGELMTEPKPRVVFEPGEPIAPGQALVLDRRTRMLHDDRHVYINGESFRAGGRDARLLRELADARTLPAVQAARFSDEAWGLLGDWADAGWLHGRDEA